MQIKRITLGGIIMTVIMFSGCSTTVQNLAIGEEKTLETGKTEQESVTEKDINMNEKTSIRHQNMGSKIRRNHNCRLWFICILQETDRRLSDYEDAFCIL